MMAQYHASLKEQGVATALLALDRAGNDLGRFAAKLALPPSTPA
jgi:hypothetical protein